MITSAVGDEGKSITSLNLALSLADDYDHTVLLIDADFRAPSLHQYLGIEPQIGFTDCINGNLDIGRAIIKTNVNKLSFLPAGKVIENPVEMISSNRMKSIVGDLKHGCADRYIIIDTPPAMPFADAHYMSSIVDGVILVVREGRASEEEIGKTLKQFEGRRLLGAIFNCADSPPFSRYYSHYYRYRGK
jgi:receptor protein-tyrosine kinase/non-specific protein-tyrosine kinase